MVGALGAVGCPGLPALGREGGPRLEGHVGGRVGAAGFARVRDRLASEHRTAAVAVLEVCAQTGRTAMSRAAASRDARGGGATLLGERLLDLPPPAC